MTDVTHFEHQASTVNGSPLPSTLCHISLPLEILIYLLTAIGLSPGDGITVHIYTQTIHRTANRLVAGTMYCQASYS